jgi:ABC-type multidrug transport system fused ATPase/permease subunit
MLRSVYSSRSFITSHLSVKSAVVQQAVRFSSTNVIVSFKKVTFGYTDTKMLLDDVSFNIREGEFYLSTSKNTDDMLSEIFFDAFLVLTWIIFEGIC